jgi:hypothetical protein
MNLLIDKSDDHINFYYRYYQFFLINQGYDNIYIPI